MNEEPLVVGIPLAFDYVYHNLAASRLVEAGGTIRRFNACVAAMKRLDPKLDRSIIICTAGWSKKFPNSQPPPNHQPHYSIAEQIRIYLNYMYNWNEITRATYTKGLCWGTEAEIRTGIQAAIQKKKINTDQPVTLVVCSNARHMPRIKYYVWLYKPRHWECVYVEAKHAFSEKSQRDEYLKIVRDLCKFRWFVRFFRWP